MANSPELEAFYQRRTRYLLRRFFWFWPTVTSIDDVERVTLLGFWVCVALAVLNIITFPFDYARADGTFEKVFAVTDTPLVAAMYYLGANALRRCNFLAATTLTVLSLSMATTIISSPHKRACFSTSCGESISRRTISPGQMRVLR